MHYLTYSGLTLEIRQPITVERVPVCDGDGRHLWDCITLTVQGEARHEY